jgi:hypothetical protein
MTCDAQVMAMDGHTYERLKIEDWCVLCDDGDLAGADSQYGMLIRVIGCRLLRKNKDRSPITGELLKSLVLMPNTVMTPQLTWHNSSPSHVHCTDLSADVGSLARAVSRPSSK